MASKHNFVTWTGLAAAVGLLMLAPASPARADAGQEVATAAQHAGYAAQSKDMKMAKSHLHHTVNCLVGPKGRGFDSKELNPCKDLGNGAIPDTTDAAKKKDLQAALNMARAGLRAKDLAAAQKHAADAEAALKKGM